MEARRNVAKRNMFFMAAGIVPDYPLNQAAVPAARDRSRPRSVGAASHSQPQDDECQQQGERREDSVRLAPSQRMPVTRLAPVPRRLIRLEAITILDGDDHSRTRLSERVSQLADALHQRAF